jgi:hypothetical protein
MAVLGTQKMTIRLGHRDAACPAGYENGIFVLFEGHHGAGGYGAWIQEPEQLFAWQQKSPGETDSQCLVEN